MRRQRSGAVEGDLAVNVIGGVAGGLAGALAMEWFQRALGRISPEVGGTPGAGGQQYREPQSEPATFKAADLLSQTAVGRPLPTEYKPAAGSAIHYAFAGSLGAIYGAAAARNRDITSAGGVPFGATVWMIADELGMPLAGLAKSPTEYPLSDHATTFVSHLLFGLITESVRRSIVAGVTSLRR